MPTDPPRDAARVRFPPPLVFALCVVPGGLLQRAWPLPFIERGPAASALGAIPVTLGVALLVVSLGQFARTRQNPEPWKPTPELIAEGIYRWTRNPMYLGMALLQTGIGVATANPWVVLLLGVSVPAVTRLAIRPEERYLEDKFGNSYRAYRRSVGRWFGRRRAARRDAAA